MSVILTDPNEVLTISEQNALPVSPDRLNDMQYILKDIMQGDMNAYKALGKDVNINVLKKAIDYIKTTADASDVELAELLGQSWRIMFRAKPPTPEEFLTYDYIGPASSRTYQRVKDTFVEFMDVNKPYRNLILYPCIGWGKSYLSTLITLYIDTYVGLLRDPYNMFGLNPASKICSVLCSYSLKKSSELLLEPFTAILESSPYYEKVPRRDAMAQKMLDFADKETVDKVYYTTAEPTSAIGFDSGITIKLSSDPSSLLGLTIVSIVYSELAFFTEKGKSSEYIMKLYNKGKDRVYSRFEGHYWGRTILDSSPNTLDNAIDQYINFDARKDPTNYIVEGSRWKWNPDTYKSEFDNNETFKVFVGNKGMPPKILIGDDDPYLNDPNVDQSRIIDVPNSLRFKFEDALVENIKDLAGIPSGSSDSLISDYTNLERMFNNKLKNFYTGIHAPANQLPEKLIWNQVQPMFFKPKGNAWEFYYKPWIPRYISVDQSYATDVTGISMVHKERIPSDESEIFIVDFTIPIVPQPDSQVNLEAIRCFIKELRDIGGLRISGVSFDQFQSKTTMQNLERDGFNVKYLSVDSSNGAYLNMLSYMNRGRLLCGKNLFFKNNLKSLRMVKASKSENSRLKIDHDSSMPQIIEGSTDWNKSLIGYYGKDISDAVSASIELCNQLCPLAQDNWDEHWFDEGKKETQKEKEKANIQALMGKLF